MTGCCGAAPAGATSCARDGWHTNNARPNGKKYLCMDYSKETSRTVKLAWSKVRHASRFIDENPAPGLLLDVQPGSRKDACRAAVSGARMDRFLRTVFLMVMRRGFGLLGRWLGLALVRASACLGTGILGSGRRWFFSS